MNDIHILFLHLVTSAIFGIYSDDANNSAFRLFPELRKTLRDLFHVRAVVSVMSVMPSRRLFGVSSLCAAGGPDGCVRRQRLFVIIVLSALTAS